MIDQSPRNRPLGLSTVAAAALALAGCQTVGSMSADMGGMEAAGAATSPRAADAPPAPVPSTAQTTPPKPSADMQAVLDALAALGPQPLTSLSPAVARQQPSFADAYARVAQQRGIALKSDAVTTQDYPYGTDDQQFVRVYRPRGTTAASALPVVVYYHGGGWVIANVDTYDATPRYLAEAMGAVVVSVEYRHAPEFKFPAQHEDAAAAYRFALSNARSWGGDPDRVALLGESAGGNLVVATAIYARDNRLPMPDHVVSVYPIANSSMALPSRTDSAQAKPLNTAALNWFGYYYKDRPSDGQDPRINLVEADLRGLPPTTIINAQADPLRSDGETLAAAMERAGVPVEQRVFPGTTHEFFGMGKVVAQALAAEQYAVRRMQADLGR